MLLVLWDVDQTLVNVDGLGGETFAEVFRRLVGRLPENSPPMSGRTDLDILGEMLRRNGVAPTSRTVARFQREFEAAFHDKVAALRRRGRALPGAVDAVAALAARPGVVQSVLTGNMRSVAELKLATFGLAAWLDFEVGAYGTESVARADLVPLAQERAGRKYGAVFDARSTVLVGDTPNDVAAGHQGGARVVAVATGRTGAAELRAAGADAVLPDLTDVDAVVAAVTGSARR
ncbi:hypothetical protein C3Y87_15325 [Carbonactinospora thermoautotrophica]|uniref:HAD family hydrolase n=1 Tax=Carbonactinospora thermoautotrophica TaxID=1469144 RepID=UPI00226FECA2|nr:haloacid dehalogenase-like hydrolase [Carbonactinospora thermoautotrophica]MCX9192758.1 hypothetical protein [Carbonactinospora thermoautotrophica]